MGDYRRTAIRRLAIQRYRSIEDLVLDDLPPIVVLHGPNGAGKSNILRAAQLVLRAAALPSAALRVPGRDEWLSISAKEANDWLDLRPEDFRFGDVPEIRVALTVDLGTRATERLFSSAPLSVLELEAVFRTNGNGSVQVWFERAELDGDRQGAAQFVESPARITLVKHLLQTSPAYRLPGGSEDPQTALYQAFLSEDPKEREAAQRLGRRLASAGLFGIQAGSVGLLPVDSRTYGEKQIRFKHPTHGELPLRNLGSGEQQVVFMLGQRVITPYPIAHIEEPEAHLHTTLMEPFAKVLRESVLGDGGTPDVDQLWMATHHHLFAIAEEFFDVSLDDKGATHVARKKRDEAVVHFYEPSPYWNTLRDLVSSGMSPDTVVSVSAEGQPIRARDVLASIEGDRRLANEFVASATKAFVLSLAQGEPSK